MASRGGIVWRRWCWMLARGSRVGGRRRRGTFGAESGTQAVTVIGCCAVARGDIHDSALRRMSYSRYRCSTSQHASNRGHRAVGVNGALLARRATNESQCMCTVCGSIERLCAYGSKSARESSRLGTSQDATPAMRALRRVALPQAQQRCNGRAQDTRHAVTPRTHKNT